MWSKTLIAALIGVLLLAEAPRLSAKDRSCFVTAKMRAAVQANAEKLPWVRQQQQQAVSAAQAWLDRSDEELWAMVPAQELPRTIYTNEGVIYKGQSPSCPGCGEAAPAKYGRSWWKFTADRPWKIECRHCGEVYPKNDFAAFYKTTLDEHGMFRRKLGDRSLLFNVDHPDESDPLHKLYVDDGYGMFDEAGKRHDVIAYYGQHAIWRPIRSALDKLARAYALTGDQRYAHKAAVLLDRIADVYPEMDYLPLHKLGFQHSQGGSGQGRIEGCIWETGVVQGMARAYDLIFDGIQQDDALIAFSSDKAKRYQLGDKSSTAALCRHIEDHLLIEALQSCKDGRISGNTGMTHLALAVNAVALDRPGTTDEWLDWLFHPDFPGARNRRKNPVPWVLVEGLDRDGMGGECGGYGLIWARCMRQLVSVLAAYPQYTKHNLVEEYPKLKQSFLVESRLNVLDAMMPNTGDSGSVGAWGRQGAASTYMLAYKLYRDPRFATLAWREHQTRHSSLRLPDDIYQPDPDALMQEIQKVALAEPYKLRSEHFGRYGQAHLQTESPKGGRAVFVHYGQGNGHSHHDCLNLGLLAKNVAMMPDLGYPEYTGSWPKRHAWTSNTISHNTLLVGDTKSAYSPGGKIQLFAVQPPLRVIQVDAPRAYPELKTYRRTVAMVDVGPGESYVLDVFRARGGRDHRLSWHGGAETAQVSGLDLVKQKTGTFAGPDVPFAKLDGDRAAFFRASGFTYLYDVERSGAAEKPYTVDWTIQDKRGRVSEGSEPHLRLHALTPSDEVALATGDAPHNRQRPRYLIQSRLGESVQSQFVNVLEPYDKTPFVKRVRSLHVEHQADDVAVVAVAVELEGGATDILISCEQPTAVKVEGGIDFHGTFGMLRLVGDRVKLIRASGATRLTLGDAQLLSERDAWRGKVVRVDASNAQNNLVVLDPPLPEGADLVGRTIHFLNDLPIDTSYEIKAVTADGISTGDITVVRGFRDRTDFTAGHTYLVNPGDEYVLPVCLGRE